MGAARLRVLYENPGLIKEDILNENKGKSGVYCWINKETGKTYIGSSVNLSRRFAQYYSSNYLAAPNRKMAIYSALLKYGHQCFQLEVLEYCEPSNVIGREQFYLDLYEPEYNILSLAGSSLGFKHSEETLAKFRARRHSEETREIMSEARIGRKASEESKRKMSEAQREITHPGRYIKGNNRPPESGRPNQKIEVFDLKENTTTTYDSMSAAAIATGVLLPTVSKYLARNQQKPYKGRYIFTKI